MKLCRSDIINAFRGEEKMSFRLKLKQSIERLNLKPSIKLKMAAVIFLLLTFVTVSSSLIVIKIMDEFILNALVKKGVSMGRSAATVAGYHMLSGDLLALDNLASHWTTSPPNSRQTRKTSSTLP
jgi:hypothetical protein